MNLAQAILIFGFVLLPLATAHAQCQCEFKNGNIEETLRRIEVNAKIGTFKKMVNEREELQEMSRHLRENAQTTNGNFEMPKGIKNFAELSQRIDMLTAQITELRDAILKLSKEPVEASAAKTDKP